MKPEIKKQIILHLPYLAFVYLFGKVGQAFRLAQGADLSAKLLHICHAFKLVFHNWQENIRTLCFSRCKAALSKAYRRFKP